MNWQEEDGYESGDGQSRVAIQTDGEGHFRFVLSTWNEAAPEGEAMSGRGTWSVDDISGLYGWRLPCRNDAQRALARRDTAQ